MATVSGGGSAEAASDTDQVPFGTDSLPFGIAPGSFGADVFAAAYPFGPAVRQAGAHPFELRTSFDLTATTGVNDGSGGDDSHYVVSNGTLRTVKLSFPPGLVGSAGALPRCKPVDFAQQGADRSSTACPPETQVGYLNLAITEGTANYGKGGEANANGLLNRVALYNLEPPVGAPADFGFSVGDTVQGHVYPTLDPTRNYALTAVLPYVSRRRNDILGCAG